MVLLMMVSISPALLCSERPLRFTTRLQQKEKKKKKGTIRDETRGIRLSWSILDMKNTSSRTLGRSRKVKSSIDYMFLENEDFLRDRASGLGQGN